MKMRGYDTPQLFREDTISRIRALYREIAEIQGRIREIKSSMNNNDPHCE